MWLQLIAGLKSFGDGIGGPIKAFSERFDAEGNLVDRSAARNSAIIGSLFDPLQALKTRGSYAGGWTDWNGEKYLNHIEEQEKERLKQEKERLENVKQKQKKIIYVLISLVVIVVVYYSLKD